MFEKSKMAAKMADMLWNLIVVMKSNLANQKLLTCQSLIFYVQPDLGDHGGWPQVLICYDKWLCRPRVNSLLPTTLDTQGISGLLNIFCYRQLLVINSYFPRLWKPFALQRMQRKLPTDHCSSDCSQQIYLLKLQQFINYIA